MHWFRHIPVPTVLLGLLAGTVLWGWYTLQGQQAVLARIEEQQQVEQAAFRQLKEELATHKHVTVGLATSILKQEDAIRDVVILTKNFNQLLQDLGKEVVRLLGDVRVLETEKLPARREKPGARKR